GRAVADRVRRARRAAGVPPLSKRRDQHRRRAGAAARGRDRARRARRGRHRRLRRRGVRADRRRDRAGGGAARRAAGWRRGGALVRALVLVGALAIPMVLIYAAAAHPLLHAVFRLTGAAAALPWLAMAMSSLALIYIAAQYQLALHRWRFIGLLAAAAVAQPL